MKYWVGLGLLLAAGVALSGCTRTSASAPAPNSSPPSPSASASPSTPMRFGTPGSDGLTVRYQGPDGRTETLRVEDFRR